MIIFQIPLTDDNVVFEWRAGEAMKMQPVYMNDASCFLKSFFHVTVFENAIPDLIGARFLMQNALVLKRLFGIHYRFQRFILNLNEFSGIVCNAR